MVEIEESAQPFAPLHVGGRAPRQWRLLQKPVVEPLMVSLAMVVLDVLHRGEAQVVLTERDRAIETFLLIDRTNRSAYAFKIGLLGGSRIGWTPLLIRMSATTRVYRGSRS